MISFTINLYMRKQKIQYFKKTLEENRENIQEELGTIAEKSEDSKYDWKSKFPNFELETFDIEDAADEVEEYINRLSVEQILEKKLEAIDKALERIKKGTYGKCKNCSKNIPEKRLEALPEAELCLDCKGK